MNKLKPSILVKYFIITMIIIISFAITIYVGRTPSSKIIGRLSHIIGTGPLFIIKMPFVLTFSAFFGMTSFAITGLTIMYAFKSAISGIADGAKILKNKF